MSSLFSSSRRTLLSGFAAGFAVAGLLFSPFHAPQNAAIAKKFSSPRSLSLADRSTSNSSLGFQKVFVINMPERPDKRDAMTMGAKLTGFEFEIVPGVRADTLSDKSRPNSWQKEWDGATFGCWRSHINIAQRMVNEGIQSALIFEDDADWDIMLKSQLHEFGQGLQQMTNPPAHQQAGPYGDQWDVLWLGNCGATHDPEATQSASYYVIDNDPTVVRTEHTYGAMPNIKAAPLRWTNESRIIFSTSWARCLAGYAITLNGAYKILAKQSVEQNAHPIDRGLSRMCSGPDLACYAVWPPYISHLQAAGDTTKDSDRQSLPAGRRDKPLTWSVKYPVLQNAWGLITGQKRIAPQWAGENKYAELDLETVVYPRGRLEVIDKSEWVVQG